MRLSRVMPVLLALIMIGGTVLAATQPNGSARDLPGDEDAVAIALAGSSSIGFNAGRVIAGSQDASSGIDDPDNTWHVWGDDSLLIRSGNAGDSDCQGDGLGTVCRAHVVDLAISDSGARIAIAARDHGADASRIIIATPAQGVLSRHELDHGVNALDMNSAGTIIAVGMDRNAFPTDEGTIQTFTWAGGSTLTEAMDHDVDEVVQHVAITASGQVAAGAGEDHYRATVGTYQKNSNFNGNVRDVAVSSGTGNAFWSVAGYSGGGVGLYASLPAFAPSDLAWDTSFGTTAQNAVEITDDGLYYFSGGADGVVRHFVNRFIDTESTKTVIKTTSPLQSPVRDMAVSTDGSHLAVAAGNSVYLYRVLPEGITQVWKDARGAAVNAVDISNDGSYVAAAVGDQVWVYEPIYDIDVTGPSGKVAATPDQPVVIDVTYTNAGNRESNITLEGLIPSGWEDPIIVPETFELAPGESQDVQFAVSIPALHPSGDREVSLRHTATGVIPRSTHFTLDVQKVSSWELQIHNAPNQDIEPGAFVYFNVTAHNLGNDEDTSAITLDVDLEDWSVIVVPDSVTLAPGAEEELNITLTAPVSAAQLDTARLTIGLEADATAALEVTATVGARRGVTASTLLPDGRDVLPGERIKVRISASNTGNAPDTFRITPGSLPIGWTVAAVDGRVPIDLLNVESGATRSVDVWVDVPTFAMPGNYQLRFAVASLGDPLVASTADALVAVTDTAPPGDGEDGGEDEPTPGFGLPLLLLAVGLAVAWRRRT